MVSRAASALLRLTRYPRGDPIWRDYHAAFLDRYGMGTQVPVIEVINPDTGLGYPATYPGSVIPEPPVVASERDERLLALAWQALADGRREVVLTGEHIDGLTAGAPIDERAVLPDADLVARIHATSIAALDRRDYVISVYPARAAGVMTSRFAPPRRQARTSTGQWCPRPSTERSGCSRRYLG